MKERLVCLQMSEGKQREQVAKQRSRKGIVGMTGGQNYGCCVYYMYLLYTVFQHSVIIFPLHRHDNVTLTFCLKSPVNACSSLCDSFLPLDRVYCYYPLVLWFGFNHQ